MEVSIVMELPFDKLSHNYGKSLLWMEENTISMAVFNSKVLVITRVNPNDWIVFLVENPWPSGWFW